MTKDNNRTTDVHKIILLLLTLVILLLFLIYVKKTYSGDTIVTTTSNDLEYYEDAFSRLRVSTPFTLGDYKHVYLNDDSLINHTENGGLISYNQNKSMVELSVNGTANSKSVHQTRIYHHYMPGKGQFILSSFVFGQSQTDVYKRTGYFDDREGIFLEMDGSGILSWIIRSAIETPGSIFKKVTRENWDDPCDGSGPSGVHLDFAKSQLLWIDFQWLGVGAVRCGFCHDRRFITAHTFFHSNNYSSPYIQNPCLPIRCECSSVSAAIGSMGQICGTIISEGGYTESGLNFSVNSGHISRDCDIGGTVYPLLAIRLKNNFKNLPNRVAVRVTDFSVYTENHGIVWGLWKLSDSSSLTGALWQDANTLSSAVEYAVYPSSVIFTSNDVQLTSGYSQAGNSNAGNNSVHIADPAKAKKNLISQNYGSTDSQIFLLVASPIGVGTNFNSYCFASIQWKEIY